MRDYGKVYTRFWLKPDVHGWSDEAKLLSLYLLTCHHCNLIGCFRLPTGYIAEDLNWESLKVETTLAELIKYDFIIRCTQSGWTLISHYLRHNPIENPNQGKAAIRLLQDVPLDFIGMPQLQNALHYFSSRLPENHRIKLENDENHEKVVSLKMNNIQQTDVTPEVSSSETAPPSDNGTASTISNSEDTAASFETFWQLQIRKEKKTQAEAEWKRLGLNTNTKLAKNIIALWQEQKSHRHQYKDKTKTPMPHNWLLHRQWEDEYVRSDEVNPSVLKQQPLKNLSLEQSNQLIAKSWSNNSLTG